METSHPGPNILLAIYNSPLLHLFWACVGVTLQMQDFQRFVLPVFVSWCFCYYPLTLFISFLSSVDSVAYSFSLF